MQMTGPLLELGCSARLARKLWPDVSPESRAYAIDAENYAFSVPVMRVHAPPDAPFLVAIDPDAFRMK